VTIIIALFSAQSIAPLLLQHAAIIAAAGLLGLMLWPACGWLWRRTRLSRAALAGECSKLAE
jgi:hypothetical protein